MLYESAFISSYYKDLWYKVGGDETVYNYTQYIKKIIGKDDKNLLDISNAKWLKNFLYIVYNYILFHLLLPYTTSLYSKKK